MDEPFDSKMDEYIRPSHRVEACFSGALGFLFVGGCMIYFINTEKYPVEFGVGVTMIVLGVFILVCTILMAKAVGYGCFRKKKWHANYSSI